MTHRSNFQNIICCTLAALIASCVIFRVGLKYLIGWLSFNVQLTLILMAVLATVIYSVIKKRKTDQKAAGGDEFFVFWHTVIRYFLAMDMISFGLQKVFHLQFSIPLAKLDNPFSEMGADDLIWAFFGKFYSFTLIIAGMQISGAILLLFRRTWLVGIFVLLPIMINILLLDWYYWISLVVNVYITILTVCAIYLLLTEYHSLSAFFFKAKSNLSAFEFKSNWQKNILRTSAVLIPIICLLTYNFPKKYPEINGKYEVKSLVINDSLQTVQPCRDSILTKVFIDYGDLVLEYNSYKRRIIGSFKYDETNQQLKAWFHYPANHPDSLFAKIASGTASGYKTLIGHMGKQTFKIELRRLNKGI